MSFIGQKIVAAFSVAAALGLAGVAANLATVQLDPGRQPSGSVALHMPHTSPPSEPGEWSYYGSYTSGSACSDQGRRWVSFGEASEFMCVQWSGGWDLWLNSEF